MKTCPICSKDMSDEVMSCPNCAEVKPMSAIEVKHIPIFSLEELMYVLGFGVFLGIAHNYLSYNLADGVGVPLFSFLFLSSFFVLVRILKMTITRNMLVVASLIFIFSAFFALRVGEMLMFFNTVALCFGYLLLVTLVVRKRFEEIQMKNYVFGFIKIIFGTFSGIGIWLGDFMSFGIKIGDTKKKMHVLKGVVMAVPLIFIFTVLFSSSDIVFGNFVSKFLNFDIIDIINASGRLINTLFYAVVFVGLFSFVSYSVRKFRKEEVVETVIDDQKHIEINVMLSAVAILFAAFIAIQIGYLFGSEQAILSQGHTYAEYATKGFQELSFIAFIVFVLFWKIDDYLYGHKKPSNSPVYKGLSSAIIILTILILFSAFHRLWLYESTYGFTEVRFYGYVFIIVLGLSLLITLYKILDFIKEGHFLASIVSICATSLIVCNIINPESFITESNTAKTYRGSLRMDSMYIGGRSEDAVDNMIKTYDKVGLEEKKNIQSQFCYMLRKLKKEYSWQEFNYAKYHAWMVLAPREKEFNCPLIRDGWIK